MNAPSKMKSDIKHFLQLGTMTNKLGNGAGISVHNGGLNV